MIDPSEVGGMYADALAAIEEASLHAYSSDAAVWAAMAHLDGASQDEATFIAAVLASWIATHLNPTVRPVDLPDWLEKAAEIAARRWT